MRCKFCQHWERTTAETGICNYIGEQIMLVGVNVVFDPPETPESDEDFNKHVGDVVLNRFETGEHFGCVHYESANLSRST